MVFCHGSLRKITPSTLSLHDGWFLQEAPEVRPQLWQRPQIKISRCLPKYLVFFQCQSWVQESDLSMGASQTQWRGPRLAAYHWVRPYCALWLHPQDLLLGRSQLLGTVVDVWLHPSGGLAESFNAFLQCGGSHQGLLVGFPGLSEISLP